MGNPPVSKSTLDQLYEFVLVKSIELANVKPNPNPFQNYFDLATDNESIIAFENLGGDSLLIAPCPEKSLNYYAHLAVFVRNASNQQCHQFLQKLAAELEKRLSNTRQFIWLSTSGSGVYWLHARGSLNLNLHKYNRFD